MWKGSKYLHFSITFGMYVDADVITEMQEHEDEDEEDDAEEREKWETRKTE